ncbi:sulfotransferase [Mesobaculum littorinae]|uniref:Sulfotransferase n=1 Tax=Mesobaculum littorinae TaxID=2486419 RepID=A0A438AKV0_9RHOB|nr:sulfotransferase [Mesobaculum littorinae]RVV99451.1 sulfotransferase [Mesobaculum littorinae]
MMGPRYVFVGGLHRSGTSLAARLLGALPGVAAITGAPVPENEGVYLQGAIPHTARDGAPMHFATDPAQHLVEGCRWDRLETRVRLVADWDPWFAQDPGRDQGPPLWRVEKSPVNLTRGRLYQQLFPMSQQVFVIRHPQVVAAAVAKWVDRPVEDLLDHWIAAHTQMEADLDYLHAALVLRYEDVVRDPSQAMAMLAAYLDVPGGTALPEQVRDGNADYPCDTALRDNQRAAAARWGYAPGGRTLPAPLRLRHPLRRVRDAVAAAHEGQAVEG